jgi:hypothetical protein
MSNTTTPANVTTLNNNFIKAYKDASNNHAYCVLDQLEIQLKLWKPSWDNAASLPVREVVRPLHCSDADLNKQGSARCATGASDAITKYNNQTFGTPAKKCDPSRIIIDASSSMIQAKLNLADTDNCSLAKIKDNLKVKDTAASSVPGGAWAVVYQGAIDSLLVISADKKLYVRPNYYKQQDLDKYVSLTYAKKTDVTAHNAETVKAEATEKLRATVKQFIDAELAAIAKLKEKLAGTTKSCASTDQASSVVTGILAKYDPRFVFTSVSVSTPLADLLKNINSGGTNKTEDKPTTTKDEEEEDDTSNTPTTTNPTTDTNKKDGITSGYSIWHMGAATTTVSILACCVILALLIMFALLYSSKRPSY